MYSDKQWCSSFRIIKSLLLLTYLLTYLLTESSHPPSTTNYHTYHSHRHHGPRLSDRLLRLAPRTGCQTTLDKISLSAGRARMRRRKWSAISGCVATRVTLPKWLRWVGDAWPCSRWNASWMGWFGSEETSAEEIRWRLERQTGRNCPYAVSRDFAIRTCTTLGAQIKVWTWFGEKNAAVICRARLIEAQLRRTIIKK